MNGLQQHSKKKLKKINKLKPLGSPTLSAGHEQEATPLLFVQRQPGPQGDGLALHGSN